MINGNKRFIICYEQVIKVNRSISVVNDKANQVQRFSHILFSASSFNDTSLVNIRHIKIFTVDIRAELQEQGTNATIDIDDYVLDESQEAAQAPIKPFTGTKPVGYIARKSSTLLGNVVKGRISSRYYKNSNETDY